MTATLPPDADWLVPPGAVTPPGRRALLLPCGVLWDALRTPETLARPALGRLLADEDDRAVLGPVLRDSRTRVVYWLISPGHTATWPDGCTLLDEGSWLAVQHPKNLHSRLTWLHLPAAPVPPATPTLTAPPWLAVVLADQLAATDPHLGTP